MPYEIGVAICPMAAAALKLSGYDDAALALGGLTLCFIATALVKDFGPQWTAPAVKSRARAAADPDCFRTVPRPSPLTEWFDAFAIVIGLICCGLLCLAIHVGDIDRIATFVGGSRGGAQEDYAPEGSCKLWLTGGPWPTDGVIDAFLLFHFLDNFVVMLAWRDFWLMWLWSPMCEICEASFQHVLPNFKECVWDSYGLDVFTFNAIGIWAGYKVLQRHGCVQYDLVAQRPQGARASDTAGRAFVMVFLLLLCAGCMCAAFFLKHVTGIKETSNWFKLFAGALRPVVVGLLATVLVLLVVTLFVQLLLRLLLLIPRPVLFIWSDTWSSFTQAPRSC